MADQHPTPGLARIDAAITAGDVPTARRELLSLSPDEAAVLRSELPPDLAERLFATARSRARTAKLGKVVVLHGITGSSLDAVHPGGGRDRAWINLLRVVGGDVLRWLELAADGTAADPTIRIEPSGLLRKWYLPLLLELDNRWDVLPFAYDWRLDIDDSAARLGAAVEKFAGGEPAHLLVHSMGGLVARRFIQLNRRLWGKLDDPSGRRRGGRLVMLGTPNRGSYAIPLTLTGAETTIKILDFADFSRGRAAVLRVLNGFLGSYQMLPSPKVVMPEDGAPDHHTLLFEAASWGDVPIRKDLLERGRAFQEQLHPVTDPERLVYVAGFDQPTPCAVRIGSPGKFLYQETRDGDGRVPHRLGLLPDVHNYFVREKHGDLPANSVVLSAVHELLQSGETSRLSDRGVISRVRASGGPAPGPAPWLPADHFVDEDVAAEFARELAAQRRDANRSAARRGPRATAQRVRQARTEAEFLDLAAGSPSEAAATAPARRKAGRKTPPKEPVHVALEVVWGDITTVEGDVYAVGHYQGVQPQYAELAIDTWLVSEIPEAECALVKPGDPRLPLTALTRQGLLRAQLGDISLFPGRHRASGRKATVAIAGMGYPGTFSRVRLQQLVSTLAHVVTTLPDVDTLCLVLIGSGAGTLQIWEAVDGMLAGLARFASDALGGIPGSRLRRVRIVEQQLGKAREIHAELYARIEWYRDMLAQARIRLTLQPDVVTATNAAGKPTGVIHPRDALAALLAATIDPSNAAAMKRTIPRIDLDMGIDQQVQRGLLDAALTEANKRARQSFQASGGLRTPGAKDGQTAGAGSVPAQRLGPPRSLADVFSISYDVDAGDSGNRSTRLSYVKAGSEVRVAAITDRTTVSERAIPVDFALVREQMRIIQAIDPEATEQEIQQCSRLLRRILLPREFRSLGMGAGQIVFDVDRAMAGVPWELLQYDADDLMPLAERDRPEVGQDPTYLGLKMPVARQLRTTLSPPPSFEGERRGRLRALIVGDPGDRDQGDDLEGARREARAIHALLEKLGVEVTLLLGAPGQSDGFAAATRSAIIDQLSRQGRPYDILHYTGHGDFDPVDPTRTGWLCSDGILGPNELRLALENGAPLLVFANACLSGRLSEARAARPGQRKAKDDGSEFGLLPTVADIFFQSGARNLVGTCREVNDEGAVLMATAFYGDLLSPGPGSPRSIGAALLEARQRLFAAASTFGSLWAAYHHYGDPTSNIRVLPANGTPVSV